MHTEPAAKEAAGMQGRSKKGKTRCTRTVLRIPDLEQSILSGLLGCGLRRAELVALSVHDLQIREDLVGFLLGLV
jgi:integrase